METKEHEMARELHCGDVVDGCDGVVAGADDDEVMEKAAVHASEAHGMDDIDAETTGAIKGAIRDA